MSPWVKEQVEGEHAGVTMVCQTGERGLYKCDGSRNRWKVIVQVERWVVKQLEKGCTNVAMGQGTGGSKRAGVTMVCQTGERGLYKCDGSRNRWKVIVQVEQGVVKQLEEGCTNVAMGQGTGGR